MEMDLRTSIIDTLNGLLASGTSGTYSGGKGIMVRNPFDGYENDTSKLVVPASFISNDIISSGTVFPDFFNWSFPDGELASMVYAVGTSLRLLVRDYDHLHHDRKGVYYAVDSNAVDDRCAWRSDMHGYDCPGGWVTARGTFQSDARYRGAGSYAFGSPLANASWGGGAGCHFSLFDSPDAKVPFINQVNASDARGQAMVLGPACQCNPAYQGKWDEWVANWMRNGSVLGPDSNPLDRMICWTDNLRDMIELQNAIYLHRKGWAAAHGPFAGEPPFGTGPQAYYGWNEVPVPRDAMTNPLNWDAVVIKLPAAVCGGDGSNDTLHCLDITVARRLEKNFERWVTSGLLRPGRGFRLSKPGSSILVMREMRRERQVGGSAGSGAGNVAGRPGGGARAASVAQDRYLLERGFEQGWQRHFFCENWTSPSMTWQVVKDSDSCYVSHSNFHGSLRSQNPDYQKRIAIQGYEHLLV